MRHSRVGLLCVVAALLLGLPPAGASASSAAAKAVDGPAAKATVIQELDFVFIPDPYRADLGQAVTWKNVTPNNHTATGNAPLSLWDSGAMAPRSTFTFTFTAAGQYPYLCLFHPQYDMVSSIGISDQVSPPSGPVGTVFTVTVATVPAPPDFVYDVQQRAPGGRWRNWMMGVTSVSILFDSTGVPTGTYHFRSRLHRVSDGAGSSYSIPASISVTP